MDALSPTRQRLVLAAVMSGLLLTGMALFLAIAGALGTLMLLRQVGASLAFAVATVLYDAGGPDRAQATGHAVFAVTLAGAAVAAAALVSLPRGAGRLPALQGAV